MRPVLQITPTESVEQAGALSKTRAPACVHKALRQPIMSCTDEHYRLRAGLTRLSANGLTSGKPWSFQRGRTAKLKGIHSVFWKDVSAYLCTI